MFEFLFENPFLLIILIGILSSMFKKKKEPNRTSPRQPEAPKKKWQEVIQEIQEEWEEKTTAKPIQEAKPVQSAEAVEVQEEDERRIAELKRLQQAYEEQQKRERESETAVSTPSIASAAAKVISDDQSPVYHKELSFGKQELINGIIMSEVLGPPRAKRSLRQSRR
ncbi:MULTISPECIES: hypothetical protein [Peribacillus]|uniref:Uncharacterized protein n=1 Tax=Peribacillus asahii TaxID=228899 RepID=A0A3Q9RQL6_9BACI|nr:hypothetical protein [Peribacillus asahii]AZV44438.1 hypothetical protein BAOM_3829 [Peribacillus asahii]USK84127.1 hypothetical protein LIT35_17060 [Peribacillus asahii]